MPRWILLYVSAITTLMSVTVTQCVFDMSKQDWAAWFQAIGSIGAIAGAFEVGRRQVNAERMRERDRDRLERTRKVEAVTAVVQHAVSQATAAVDGFQKIQTDVLLDVLRVDLYGLTVASNAILSIPLHEVGPASAVVQFAQLQVTLKEMGRKVEQFKTLDRSAALLEHPLMIGDLVFNLHIARHSASEFTKIVSAEPRN